MKNEQMEIGQVASRLGITVRTLHYYDQIGLVVPRKYTKSKYRLYGAEEIERLEQILFLKEIGFELKKIKQLLESPNYNKIEVYKRQRNYIYEKRKQLDKMIVRLDQLIGDQKNDLRPSVASDEQEDQIYLLQKQYYEEIKALYEESEAIQHFESNCKPFGKKAKWQEIDEVARKLFEQIARVRYKGAEDKEVQELIKKWQNYIDENLYPCSLEMLELLGKLYVEDERFYQYFENIQVGLADFVQEAIRIYRNNEIDK